jgi:hypothetical protein
LWFTPAYATFVPRRIDTEPAILVEQSAGRLRIRPLRIGRLYGGKVDKKAEAISSGSELAGSPG